MANGRPSAVTTKLASSHASRVCWATTIRSRPGARASCRPLDGRLHAGGVFALRRGGGGLMAPGEPLLALIGKDIEYVTGLDPPLVRLPEGSFEQVTVVLHEHL